MALSFQYSLGVKRDEMRKLEEIAQVSYHIQAIIIELTFNSQKWSIWNFYP